MSIQYRKAKIKLNYLEEKPEVYKLRQLTFPQVTPDQLISEISQSQGINTSQTKAVIDALLNRMIHYMSIGHGVNLGSGFGSFKPVFTSKAAKTLEECDETTIRKKKINFYPGKAFKDMLSDLTVTSASETLDVQE